MVKYLFIALLFLGFFFSCTGKKEAEDRSSATNYKIDISRQLRDVPVDSLIDSVFYVKLDTYDENMIGEISRLKIDSLIAIYDKMTDMLHFYSMEGRFLSLIHRVGNGPGEYVRIDDFVLHPDRQSVEVLDGTQNKIIEYSFAGDLIGEKKISLPPGLSCFATVGDKYVYDQQIRRNAPDDCYNLVLTTAAGEVTDRYLPYKKFSDVVLTPRHSLFYVGDTLVYQPTYSNVLYNVESSRITPRCVFDFGEQWLDEEYVYSFKQDPLAFVGGFKDTKGIYFFNATETPSHFFLDFMYKENTFFAVVDKPACRVAVVKEATGGNCDIPYTPQTAWKDFYVTSVGREKIDLSGGEEENINANPVLLFYKLKRL